MLKSEERARAANTQQNIQTIYHQQKGKMTPLLEPHVDINLLCWTAINKD